MATLPCPAIVAGAAAVFLALGCGSSSEKPAATAPPQDAEPPADAATEEGGPAGPLPLALAPGEVAEVDVAEGVGGARLATPGGQEQFVLVLASTLFDTSGTPFDYAVALDAAPAGAKAAKRTGCALDDAAWKNAPLPVETPPSGPAPAVGAKRTIDVWTSTPEKIDVEAVAVGTGAVVWKDVTPAHPATLDATFVSQFLDDFDKTILPRARTIFGVESDLDGDGRIGLVFTPVTKKVAVAFFSGCDLKKLKGCPAGNGSELLYLTPPADIAPPYNTPAAIKEILAHELSHLLHFNRKVLRNKLANWPDSSYLIEGTGALAQDTVGFQAGNLYVTKAGLDQVGEFSLGDVLVDDVPYDMKRDGPMRGGSYLFVRWLYDRGGGDLAAPDGTIQSRGGPALLRALLDAPKSVAESLPSTAKTDAVEAAVDFYTALAMSNREDVGGTAPANGCFAFLPTATDPVTTKQRGANVYAKFHGQQMAGPKSAPVAEADGKLRAGGVEYLVLDAAGGGTETPFTVTVDAAALPRVRVGRLK